MVDNWNFGPWPVVVVVVVPSVESSPTPETLLDLAGAVPTISALRAVQS